MSNTMKIGNYTVNDLLRHATEFVDPDHDRNAVYNVRITDIRSNYGGWWSRGSIIGIQMSASSTAHHPHVRKVMVKDGCIDLDKLKVKYTELKALAAEYQVVQDRKYKTINDDKTARENLMIETGVATRVEGSIRLQTCTDISINGKQDQYSVSFHNLTTEQVKHMISEYRKMAVSE